MATRAMWKGVIRFGGAEVPVKLYSAVEDRSVHFRLLHSPDLVPVTQSMVNPETDEVVPYEAARRGYVTEEGRIVLVDPDELSPLEPEPSRDIEVTRFLPPAAIGHLWYDRPYFLGPDGGTRPYFALIEALRRSEKEGLARWVMRKREYAGALRLHGGHPVLITLRHAGEVVPVEALTAPEGRPIDKKELAMARQLMSMLEDEFDPTQYRDEYRARVLNLIETKARGGTVRFQQAPRKRPAEDLTKALRASLERERKSA